MYLPAKKNFSEQFHLWLEGNVEEPNGDRQQYRRLKANTLGPDMG